MVQYSRLNTCISLKKKVENRNWTVAQKLELLKLESGASVKQVRELFIVHGKSDFKLNMFNLLFNLLL